MYFPSKLGRAGSHTGIYRGGQGIENVPTVRFEIESNCEELKKVSCAGYFTADSMILHQPLKLSPYRYSETKVLEERRV